ncbi:MAG: UDP-N-acetylglucosamine--N-acetylmuramyl-(pentapeptide) pyrophosphoryl-undecaprenol N-acetylglucosamine transferase [Acidimicrobiia bacterium]|nr:UDP-N-acetylglucosamine--N-acetylmuramyl-(pentapeptide) pyrophosphoryl-undecaprenol N-acetylglucosamine transferase [Acidimicrobiia bacterium]MDH5502783.1 UDP-N-acetylglucosamine--N-acetylmuramyl-(pentapeptide) pyrophosphoryl-undecaprenol N-acetylglucosamine transferase [Acidimicrobiia bacterium]
MTYAIAAAGTGGHVFPALAIAEALERTGVERTDIVFFGGDRFESEAVPAAGYDFVRLELRGLKRSFTPSNLGIPGVVLNARRTIGEELVRRQVGALVATGGYVTVPAAWAAQRASVPYFVQEQNAHAGLANRLMSRKAVAAFTSFPVTEGLSRGVYCGNPLRTAFVDFDRQALRAGALVHYGLEPDLPVLGVVGGSLGAGALNAAVHSMVLGWAGPPIQIIHLTGELHVEAVSQLTNPREVPWKVVAFETSMELFFAAADLLLARAGGMVAEITATGTPAILVPGEFGSKGHQLATARFVEAAGGAVVIEQANIDAVPDEVERIIGDPQLLAEMSSRSRGLGRPRAADEIANRMVSVHG